jgi:hypothetical protein
MTKTLRANLLVAFGLVVVKFHPGGDVGMG